MPINRLSSQSSDVVRRIRRAAGRIALGLGVALALACDNAPSSRTADSGQIASDADYSDSDTSALVASGWNVDAGPFIVLPTVDGGLTSGSLLRPEATELTVGDTTGLGAQSGSREFELFDRHGLVGKARITVGVPVPLEPGCTAWPVARLVLDPNSPSVPWTAAFYAGRVTAIPLDSIEGLAPRDSARLAIELARLASALPNDTVATFRGLPFVVLRAWQTRGLDSGFIVATLARRVNQEDSPREERLVLVIDQIGPSPKTWTVAWHERASGAEEELVVAEPLLAFRAGTSTDVHLLFGRDDGIALGAAVLTRSATSWRVQWESAVAGCD